MGSIHKTISENVKAGKKMFAWLIDPDKYTIKSLEERLIIAQKTSLDFVLIGGSLLMQNRINEIIKLVKSYVSIPVILFPGNSMQVNENADGILFLSLISGRNADYLIGKHVEISMMLKKSNLEILPTGYMIINTGIPTSVSYISNTTPIPYDKAEIAVCTAIAGELLGLKLIFIEGGSGAKIPVDIKMVRAVKDNIGIPLIVGGGIVDVLQLKEILNAGADIIVAGNGIEKNPDLIAEFSDAVNLFNV
jgi:phosphoglycerol geranylgeranyltransferase